MSNYKFQTSKKSKLGFTLMELLVVVTIFVVISIIVVNVVLTSIRGSLKVDRSVAVRENLDYALGVFGREIRGAKEITSCPSVSQINFVDVDGVNTVFRCVMGDGWGYIDLGGERVTGDNVVVTTCNFSCVSSGFSGVLDYVDLSVSGKSASGNEDPITLSTRVNLRNY